MRSWLPTLSLSFAAFIFVTSEFIPVGLITEIGQSFGRNESQTGILMTVYAWLVALLSLPLTAYAARFNRRPLMLTLLGVFVIAHAVSAIAASFGVLMISRLFVAAVHAVFWAITIPLGIRLAPEGNRERAMSIVATGATLGGVLGIPLGTLFGQMFGWRATFAAIGVCAAVVALALHRLLPPTPAQNAGDFRSIVPLMKRKELALVYLTTTIIMTGHYAAYTFISPFLHQVAKLPKDWIASILLVFGCAGFMGTCFAPRLLREHLKRTALVSLAILAACLFALRSAADAYPLMLGLVVVWGFSFMLFNLVLQNLVLQIAPDAEDVAMAGFSGIYNVGIGGGALIGSLASVDHLHEIGYVGSAFVIASFVTCWLVFRCGKLSIQ